MESIPLITASILSKKLAAGLDGLVMDVKVGNGAFMVSIDAARELAGSIARVASGAGVPTVAYLTAMDQPLASVAGNALEIAYTADYLTGRLHEPRLHDVVMTLGAEMLVVGGLAPSHDAARRLLEAARVSGAGAERFAAMVHALGGPHAVVEAPWSVLERSPVVVDVTPRRPGVVTAIEVRMETPRTTDGGSPVAP